MADFSSLLRPHLRGLAAYSSARDEFSGTASVYLDANENPFAPTEAPAYNRYPDPYQQELKEAIAKEKGVDAAQIFLGNGSDEPIDLLIRAFCEPVSEAVLLTPPTYGMYQVSAGINNVEILTVPLTDRFQLDLERLLPVLENERLKLLFLCSPNNPTGNLLHPKDMEAVLKKFKGLVVIDEAYIDFADSPSWLKRLTEFPQLIVLQTFSKAWGLAGLRLGMAFAHPEIVQILNRIKQPYNINAYTQQFALEAIGKAAEMRKQLAYLKNERQRVADRLADMPQVEEVYPSDANFLLVRLQKARAAYEHLLHRGIVVRDRSRVILCEDCLRITIGLQEENEQLLNALQLWYHTSSMNTLV